jgi:creatinine amidohydrolase
VAVLPWGATEAHNYHLPYGTDVVEATALAERAAALAVERGAKPLVLPTIPFGNNAQQQDQVATIHVSTATALALLRDVAESLQRQGIDRLVVLNAHGGNDLKPLVRDVMLQCGILIVVVNFWQVREDDRERIFTQPGDHADEMETSLMLHLRPEWVVMDQAGPGESVAWKLKSLQQPGVWTPRPWSHVHPDTGSGDPSEATAAKGAEYFEILSAAIADVLVELSAAKKGDLPYV